MYAPRRESSAARYGFAGRSLRFRYWPKVMARSSVRLLSRASFVAGAEAPPGWSAVNASPMPPALTAIAATVAAAAPAPRRSRFARRARPDPSSASRRRIRMSTSYSQRESLSSQAWRRLND